jgi:hypothetical protein
MPNSHFHITFFEDHVICTCISELVVSLERFHRKRTVRCTHTRYMPSLSPSFITIFCYYCVVNKIYEALHYVVFSPSVILLLLLHTSTCSFQHLLPTRTDIILTYRLAQKSVNCLVKSTIKTLEIPLLLNWLVKCTIKCFEIFFII